MKSFADYLEEVQHSSKWDEQQKLKEQKKEKKNRNIETVRNEVSKVVKELHNMIGKVVDSNLKDELNKKLTSLQTSLKLMEFSE